MKTIKSIIKRISPSTIEKLEREKKGNELLKEVIKELINIYDAIELEEYFEIQKDLLAYYKKEPEKTVDTWWDFGVNDTTSIWFTQQYGKEPKKEEIKIFKG